MKRINGIRWFFYFCLLGLFALGSISYASDTPPPTPDADVAPVPDPYEKFNRSMFSFNDTLDTYIVKPVAILYNKIIPRPLNAGIHNVFLNINELPTIANDILQLHFYQAANDAWRFVINTTIGIFGLFDVASRMQLDYYANDFGLTLYNWGYHDSNYLVLPFYGSYTVRDALSLPIDYLYFSIYPHIFPYRTRYAIYAVGVVDKRATLLQYEDVMEVAALDKYIFVREAAMQLRAAQIEENMQLSCKPVRPKPVYKVKKNTT